MSSFTHLILDDLSILLLWRMIRLLSVCKLVAIQVLFISLHNIRVLVQYQTGSKI